MIESELQILNGSLIHTVPATDYRKCDGKNITKTSIVYRIYSYRWRTHSLNYGTKFLDTSLSPCSVIFQQSAWSTKTESFLGTTANNKHRFRQRIFKCMCIQTPTHLLTRVRVRVHVQSEKGGGLLLPNKFDMHKKAYHPVPRIL